MLFPVFPLIPNIRMKSASKSPTFGTVGPGLRDRCGRGTRICRSFAIFLGAVATFVGDVRSEIANSKVVQVAPSLKILSDSDLQKIRTVHHAWKASFRSDARGFCAENDANDWWIQCGSRNLELHSRRTDSHWSLQVDRFGEQGSEQQVDVFAPPFVRATQSRLSRQWCWWFEEWYVNRDNGLEHGFTVQAPHPGGTTASQFRIEMSVSAGWNVCSDSTDASVIFVSAADGSKVSYGGLKVWDSTGRSLPAGIASVGPASIAIEFDISDAVYPVMVDPLIQQVYIKPSNPSALDQFGAVVAVDGNTVVVGAPEEDGSGTGVNPPASDGTGNSGAAYIFVRDSDGWFQQAYLKASNTDGNDRFGYSVAISGNTVVVGAHAEDGSGTGTNPPSDEAAAGAGAAYVFVRNGSTWTQEAYLKASNARARSNFGSSVAVSGNMIVVGAYSEDGTGTGVNPPTTVNDESDNHGAAYILRENRVFGSKRHTSRHPTAIQGIALVGLSPCRRMTMSLLERPTKMEAGLASILRTTTRRSTQVPPTFFIAKKGSGTRVPT